MFSFTLLFSFVLLFFSALSFPNGRSRVAVGVPPSCVRRG